MGKKGIVVVLLVGLSLASFRLAEAQQPAKKPLIGVLVAGSPSSMESRIKAFQKRLRELGYKEGQNIVVEYHYAEGNYNRLTAIATDLVRSQANVIVTWAIPVTQVVKNATNTTPIVMAGGGNPVEASLIESLSKPGGNITGLATIQKLRDRDDSVAGARRGRSERQQAIQRCTCVSTFTHLHCLARSSHP